MMEKFISKFHFDRVVLPVIHVKTWDQTVENAELARDCGADGIWLINHGDVTDDVVLDWHKQLIETTGWSKIGVNLLSLSTVEAIEKVSKLNNLMGLWADNAGVLDYSVAVAEEINEKRPLLGDEILGPLYFGGVAFKYQRGVYDLKAVTAKAVQYVDVITTSGSGTGNAASVEKIATMREAAPYVPLAIASGITPENVVNYLPYANAFMVASGIAKEGDFYNIDRDKLVELIRKVREGL